MQFSCSLLVALCLLLSSFRSAECGCRLQADNSTYCDKLELSSEEPARVDRATKVAYISFSKGSINAKTLEPFQDTESLGFYSDEISRVEDGALCSLPNLKELYITHSSFPNLTRGILRGCQRIRKFRIYHIPLEEDALHEMTNVKDLELGRPLPANFNKVYLEPLKHLEVLLLEIHDLNKVDAGLFCSSPVIEDVKLYLRSHIQITESLFEGCSSLKKLFMTGREVVIEGNPFSNLPHLEELELAQIPFTRITKEFLTGFPNLKTLQIREANVKIYNDAFQNIPHLTTLVLQGGRLEDSNMEALNPLSDLVLLDLSGNSIESLDPIPALPSLESLNAGFNSISTFDFPGLKRKLPKLKRINLEVNSIVPELEEELEKEETIKVNLVQRDIPV